jgi:hypothetical protein
MANARIWPYAVFEKNVGQEVSDAYDPDKSVSVDQKSQQSRADAPELLAAQVKKLEPPAKVPENAEQISQSTTMTGGAANAAQNLVDAERQTTEALVSAGQLTRESAVKRQYKVAKANGLVKTKFHENYWQSMILIAQNLDNRYISAEDAEADMAKAKALLESQIPQR